MRFFLSFGTLVFSLAAGFFLFLAQGVGAILPSLERKLVKATVSASRREVRLSAASDSRREARAPADTGYLAGA